MGDQVRWAEVYINPAYAQNIPGMPCADVLELAACLKASGLIDDIEEWLP